MSRHPHSRLGPARWKLLVVAALLTGVTAAARQQVPPAGQAQPPQQTTQQPSDVSLVITGGGGSVPHYAIPDFVILNPEATDLGKLLAQVLWDDLAYEREVDP